MQLSRAAEHGAVPGGEEAQGADVRYYGTLIFLAAAVIGVSLAILWDNQVSDPIAMAIQKGIVGATTPAEVAGALGLAFVAGASMVVTACGLPQLFAVSPLVEEAKTRQGWMFAALLYAAGNVLVAAIVGAAVASLGNLVLQPLAGEGRLALPAIVYSLVGVFALAYALVEFGWLALPVPGFHAEVPEFVNKTTFYPRSFLLGLVVGGGFTLGCPFPTYHVLLSWIAASANLALGALVLGVYGLGRSFPVFMVGFVLFAGTRPQVITRWVKEHLSVVHLVNGLGLTILGSFMLTYWGLLLSVRLIVR